ncbi:MAG: ABC transporter ATP-binding protein [Selenomonadaceae bacterium]|nr:ABC transporter ATP-binding protein [Selenomonadaceae bacterium]
MKTLLRYDRVDVSYNGAPVVHDVSFSLREGEILGVVGESGSGKSTLLKAAMGLLGSGGVVTRGDIWYREKNLPDLSEEELRRLSGAEIAMVFQQAGASFCPVRSVGAQLFEAVSAHEDISEADFREKAAALLQKLRFEDASRILESYPFELSGGMMQRVGIAAAMLLNPAVLLADEPTSALDVSVQKQAVEEMLLIREFYHTSIVIVTHNIGVVRAMADRVVVMREGRIVESGGTRDVLENPAREYTKKLMAAVPKLRFRRGA